MKVSVRAGMVAVVFAAVVSMGVVVGPAVPAGAQAGGSLPILSGVEFRDLYNRLEPIAGSRKLTSLPPITGNAAADQRIRSLAVARGYRVRSQHTGTLATVMGVPMNREAASQLAALQRRAAASGYGLSASFGYRSAELQRTLFNRRICCFSADQIRRGAADGIINATLRWVAAPGYSKHQSGMAVDLRAPGGTGGGFAGSSVGRWMAANNHRMAKEYGFIPSYPSGAGLQGPEPEPWEYVYVGRRAIGCAVPLARHNDRAAFEACMGTGPIARKYQQLGGPSGVMGAPVAPEAAVSDRRGRLARYRNGNIYWTTTTGAREVRNPILREFANQGGVHGILRYPVTDTTTSRDRRSTYNTFERGRIYHRSAVGTITVPQGFFTKHEDLRGVHGVLGYPVAAVRNAADGRSRYQNYERGRIYSVGGRTVEIHGAVFTHHETIRGVYGPLGYPAGDLGEVGDGRGKAQWFEGGLVWYTPGLGAHGLWGPILDRYIANGHVRSSLGYPTASPTAIEGGAFATFERGRIYARTGGVAHQVTGAVLEAYLEDFGGPEGIVGYPVSAFVSAGSSGDGSQQFERGTLRISAGVVTLG